MIGHPSAVPGDQYSTLAASIAADLLKLVLKHEESLFVADHRGDPTTSGEDGLVRHEHYSTPVAPTVTLGEDCSKRTLPTTKKTVSARLMWTPRRSSLTSCSRFLSSAIARAAQPLGRLPVGDEPSG
jgi:hypothetical protein